MIRDEALALVREFVQNDGLVRHMLCVEACMRLYAEKFGEDVETWGQLGLIHDFDWEIHPTLEEHPSKGAAILRERGVAEDLIQDILSHGIGTGVPRDTVRRKALYACDEITGLVTAVALVRRSPLLVALHQRPLSRIRAPLRRRNGSASAWLRTRIAKSLGRAPAWMRSWIIAATPSASMASRNTSAATAQPTSGSTHSPSWITAWRSATPPNRAKATGSRGTLAKSV